MLRSRTIASYGFHERDGREGPHVDKNPAYAVNPESERAESRCLDLGSREFEIPTPEMQSGAGFPRRTEGEQNLPAVLPAVGLSYNDFQ
jgi:hypothetical protein